MNEIKLESKREMPGLVLLWNYPEIWWKRRKVLPRLFLLAVVFALVGSLSVAIYDARVRGEYERLMNIQTKNIEELSRLTSEVKSERASVQEKGESEVLKEIEKVKEELRDLQLEAGKNETGVLNTSVEDALAALELAYPSTESGRVEF